MKRTFPEIEAKRYEEKLKKGNYLIAVHTDESEDVDRAKNIFKTAGAGRCQQRQRGISSESLDTLPPKATNSSQST